MENTIVGTREFGSGVRWTVDGENVSLVRSLQVRAHSPTGFEFGYYGSGPAQSALAILLHVIGVRNADEWPGGWQGGDAERVYQDFKDEFIGPLPHDEQRVEFVVDVEAWVDAMIARREAGRREVA